MTRARQLEIERMRDEAQAGLRTVTTEELWELVDELLDDAELVGAFDRMETPLARVVAAGQ